MSVHYPSYRLHKPSGQAVVTIAGKDCYLGRFGDPASKAEYDRLIAEWLANGRRLPCPGDVLPELAVKDVILAFWKHVERHYCTPDSTPSREQEDFKLSLRPLKHIYGPRALKAVRQLMVEGYEHPKYGTQQPLSRGVINQRIGRIRRMFKWAVAEELVAETVYRALMAVSGLQRGRTEARETEPVKPVADVVVDATLPFLRPQPAAMVQLQRHTGMRPGDVVIIRSLDLDTSGDVWFYRPGCDQGPHGKHKNAWRGHGKVIAIGPKAQEILKPWLRLSLSEYLFQPRETMAAFRAEQRRNRKTRVQPSQQKRSKARAKKLPGEKYTSRSYAQAVAKAVEKANTARACEECKEKKPEERCKACKAAALPHWHPHQLRHTKATEIRREHGLDAARAVLGHRSPKITEVYAEVDMNKAAEVMRKMG